MTGPHLAPLQQTVQLTIEYNVGEGDAHFIQLPDILTLRKEGGKAIVWHSLQHAG
jgi:hypothetical protein